MEATPEENAEGLAIVRVLAAVLNRLVASNAPIAQADPGQVTKFHAMKVPGIGIEQYLERIHKYASCSKECFILALIYIDRLIQRTNFLLTELNVHRVVITAILLAAKFFDDAYYNNAYYAKVGGVLVSEMNGLEVDFLFRINFSLHVTPDVFDKYRMELLSHSAVALLPSSQPVTISNHSSPLHQPMNLQQVNPSVMPLHHQNSQEHCDALLMASKITPSPPAEAGRMIVDDNHFHAHQQPDIRVVPTSYYVDSGFQPMQRSNSMPMAIKSGLSPYRHQLVPSIPRCSNASYSAPPLQPSAPMQILYPSADPFGGMVSMENALFVTIPHAGYPAGVADTNAYEASQRLLSGHMLTSRGH